MTAFAQEADFFRRRHAYLENDVGGGPKLGGSLDNLCACGTVGFVTAIGSVSGTGFHGNRKSKLDEFFNHLRHCGNTFFPCGYFPWNSYHQWHVVFRFNKIILGLLISQAIKTLVPATRKCDGTSKIFRLSTFFFASDKVDALFEVIYHCANLPRPLTPE